MPVSLDIIYICFLVMVTDLEILDVDETRFIMLTIVKIVMASMYNLVTN